MKKIDNKYYTNFMDSHFGEQVIESLQLCSMLKKKDESGYYHVEHTVPFVNINPSDVYRVELEKEVKWDYTEGKTPEPMEIQEEEKDAHEKSKEFLLRQSRIEAAKKVKPVKSRQIIVSKEVMLGFKDRVT